MSTREPGGTATGEMIRGILQHNTADEPLADRTELLLFTASRAQLMARVILPALERGDWVLCDRFIDSTIAYQGYARGMDIETLNRINDFAVSLRKPDLTLLLDIDVERGFQRLQQRYADGGASHDRIEKESRAFHQAVRDGYLNLAQGEPDRFRIINADQPVEAVFEELWGRVEGVLFP